MATGRLKEDDCFYFVFSTCEQGADCKYRHCVEALGSKVTCRNWLKGSCKKTNCPYRHMKPLKSIHDQCCFESKPSGCRKPHCMFKHTRDRKAILDDMQNSPESLILPVSPKVSAAAKQRNEILSLTKQFVSSLSPSDINANRTPFKKSKGLQRNYLMAKLAERKAQDTVNLKMEAKGKMDDILKHKMINDALDAYKSRIEESERLIQKLAREKSEGCQRTQDTKDENTKEDDDVTSCSKTPDQFLIQF